jgi:hypothetical protein
LQRENMQQHIFQSLQSREKSDPGYSRNKALK